MAQRQRKLAYPRRCGILVDVRERTDRERWIDLRPGAENPRTPTRPCGELLSSLSEDRRHMASVHRAISAVIELLAEARRRGIRAHP
jgi:hypothetical protein